MKKEAQQLRADLIRFAMRDAKTNSFYIRKKVEKVVDEYLKSINVKVIKR